MALGCRLLRLSDKGSGFIVCLSRREIKTSQAIQLYTSHLMRYLGRGGGGGSSKGF